MLACAASLRRGPYYYETLQLLRATFFPIHNIRRPFVFSAFQTLSKSAQLHDFTAFSAPLFS